MASVISCRGVALDVVQTVNACGGYCRRYVSLLGVDVDGLKGALTCFRNLVQSTQVDAANMGVCGPK